MIRMLIVGYGLGIRSGASAVREEVHLWHLAYRWFCRLGLDGDVPDHSIAFSKNRHGRFPRERSLAQAVRDRGGALHDGRDCGRRCEAFAVDASIIVAGRASTARCRQGRRFSSDFRRRAVAEYLSVLDSDAAFSGATPVEPEGDLPNRSGRPLQPLRPTLSPIVPTLTTASSSRSRKHGVIMDVEATTTVRQAEVGAAKTMLDRTAEQFEVQLRRAWSPMRVTARPR